MAEKKNPSNSKRQWQVCQEQRDSNPVNWKRKRGKGRKRTESRAQLLLEENVCCYFNRHISIRVTHTALRGILPAEYLYYDTSSFGFTPPSFAKCALGYILTCWDMRSVTFVSTKRLFWEQSSCRAELCWGCQLYNLKERNLNMNSATFLCFFFIACGLFLTCIKTSLFVLLRSCSRTSESVDKQ